MKKSRKNAFTPGEISFAAIQIQKLLLNGLIKLTLTTKDKRKAIFIATLNLLKVTLKLDKDNSLKFSKEPNNVNSFIVNFP